MTDIQLDTRTLGAWLTGKIDIEVESLSATAFPSGQSNPTFCITDGVHRYVLRKKPPGALLSSAHAVEREYRVLRALAGSAVPVPRVYALCEDATILGTPFFIMEHLDGRTHQDVTLPGASPAERAATYQELARVLATVHGVDIKSAGLESFGRADGYLERQVRRWTQQYVDAGPRQHPDMNWLITTLPDRIPDTSRTTLTHGDYRLDNLIMSRSAPRALGLIDWELSTLGDPLADLAFVCMLYDVALPTVGTLSGVNFDASGIPSEAEFVSAYLAAAEGESVPHWSFYKAFALFRMASIAEGVYQRGLQGNAASVHAAEFGPAVAELSAAARRSLS